MSDHNLRNPKNNKTATFYMDTGMWQTEDYKSYAYPEVRELGYYPSHELVPAGKGRMRVRRDTDKQRLEEWQEETVQLDSGVYLSGNGVKLVDTVAAIIGLRPRNTQSAPITGKYKALSMVLANAVWRNCDRSEGFHAYKCSNMWTKADPWNPQEITFSNLHGTHGVTPRLIKHGLLREKVGYRNPETGAAYVSRYRVLPDLTFLIERCGVGINDVRRDRQLDEVLYVRTAVKEGGDFRTGHKADYPYVRSAHTLRMRQELKRYAKAIEGYDIHVPGRPVPRDQYSRVYRVFQEDNGFWEHGGRHVAVWQKLPKKVRLMGTINGQPLVELDYCGNHVKLLYASVGVWYDGDPYGCFVPELREVAKGIVLRILNTKTEESLNRSIGRAKWKHPEWVATAKAYGTTLLSMVQTLKEVHAPIAQFFHADIGVRMQNVESEIGARVVDTLVKANAPVLVIHDSFMTTEENEQLLWDTMVGCWQAVAGVTCRNPASLVEKVVPK